MTTVEERKRFFNAIPKIELLDVHVEGGQIVQSRLAMLDRLPKGMRVLELGVAQGEFILELWNRLKPSHLT